MRACYGFTRWAFVVTVAGCGAVTPRSDDFLGKLKSGCSSRDECKALVTEARHRLVECDSYLVGNNITRGDRHLCTHEKGDYCTALERTLEWGVRSHVRPLTTGESIADAPAGVREDGKRPLVHPTEANSEAAARFLARLSPFARQAQATFPKARRRFLDGLASGESLLLMIVVQDDRGFFEPAYVRVERIERGVVSGRLASDIVVVRGYMRGGRVEMNEANLLDWVLSNRDGSMEGSILGKYLAVLW
jgi:hypothetical protein